MGYTGLTFAALFLTALVLSLARSPIYGVYAYLAAFYVHPPSRWWGAGLPDIRWSLLASVVLLLSVIIKRDRRRKSDFFSRGPAILLIVFSLWLWAQLQWALDFDEQLSLAVLFTKYTVLLFVLYEVLQEEDDLRKFLLANVVGCGYLGYLAWQAGGGGRLEGVGGPGINEANALGLQIGVGVMCASMLLLVMRNAWSLLVLVMAPLMAIGLVQTVSRSAFLAVLMGGVALWYLRPKGYSKLFYTFAACATVGFLTVAGQHYWARMSTVQDAVDESAQIDKSAQSRLIIAAAQWEMFKLYPMGAGHRGTAVLSPLFIDDTYLTGDEATGGRARSSHNTFLTLLVEHGVPGAFMFFIALVWTTRVVLRLRQLDRHGMPPMFGAATSAAAAGLVVVLVGGLFVDYLKMEVQIWCLAMLLSLVRIAERKRLWTLSEKDDAAAKGAMIEVQVGEQQSVRPPRSGRRRRRLIGEGQPGRAVPGNRFEVDSGR